MERYARKPADEAPVDRRAADVRPLDQDEAAALLTVELGRVISLLRALEPDEWFRPTVCPGWTVRDIVAHLDGCNANYARPTEIVRQLRGWVRQRDRGLLAGLNQAQIAARAGLSPAELIDRLAAHGRRSIRTRHRLPQPLRRVPLLFPGVGIRPLGYFLDELFAREMWIHRIDLERATGRSPQATADHDGRQIALLVKDLDAVLPRRLGGATIGLDLTGPAGGRWLIGPAPTPTAWCQFDALELPYLTSGRTDPDTLTHGTGGSLSGDPAFGRRALRSARLVI